MQRSGSPWRLALFGAAVAACLNGAPARAVDAGICRDVERRYTLIRSEITSVQLNATLFQAADKGCEPLVRTLLAAGASLEARDRLGAMPLAYAARSGHLALIDFFEAGRGDRYTQPRRLDRALRGHRERPVACRTAAPGKGRRSETLRTR